MKRIYKPCIRLSPEEFELLNERAKKTDRTLSAYIRETALKRPPREKPPEDFYEYMKFLRMASNNLNQIAVVANTYKHIDSKSIKALAVKLDKFMLDVREKYLGGG